MKSEPKTSHHSLPFGLIKIFKNLKIHLLLTVILFLIGLVVFWRFFYFSLWGDDFMLSFYILEHRMAGTLPRLYFSLYGGQALFMDLMNHVFNFVPKYYFYASYFLRFIATVSIYATAFYISKNKLISFMAGLLFITSFAGIESTNWVHNSVNYLALTLFLSGYVFWLKSKNENYIKAFWSVVAYFLFFSFAIAVAGVRMPGLIPSYIFIEIFSLYLKKSTFKGVLARCTILFGIFFIFTRLGFFGSVVNFTSGQLKSGMFTYIQEDPIYIFKFISYPFGSFANSIIPSNLLSNNHLYKQFLVNVNISIFEVIIFSIPVLILFLKLLRISKNFAVYYIVSWVGVFYFFINGFGDPLGEYGSQILLGIMLVFLFAYLSYRISKTTNKKLNHIIIELFVMAISFVIVTHALLVNHSTIESYSRYLTISSGLVSVFLSLIFFYSLKRIIYIFTILILILINTVGAKHFFKESMSRVNDKARIVWDDINTLGKQYPYRGQTRLFAFDYPESERGFHQTAIGFGGTYRYAIENKIDDRSKLVVFVSMDELGIILDSLNSPVVAMKRWGPMIKSDFSIDNIHGFYLKDGRVSESREIIDKIQRLQK